MEENKDKKIEKQEKVKETLWQSAKFTLFSISAGLIQIASFELMYDIIGWKSWWATYLISLVLSVVWNFTFNRKFTFKSANNVPIAMSLVFLYYCAFTPTSVFGGNALEDIGWNGTIVTGIMMALNFVTEFLWCKFVVFRGQENTNELAKRQAEKKNALKEQNDIK